MALSAVRSGHRPLIIFNAAFATLIAFLTGIGTDAVQSTRSRLEAEKEQLRKEVYKGFKRVQGQEAQLQAASEIQANLLPKIIPQIPGVQISCAWQPAQVVTGDYFDVIAFPRKKSASVLPTWSAKESEPPCLWLIFRQPSAPLSSRRPALLPLRKAQ